MQQCWPNQVGCLAARDPPMAVTSAHAHGMSKGLSTQCLRIGAAFVQDIIHTHMLWWERKCGRSLVKNLDRPLSWHKGYDYIICISSLFFIISIFQLFFKCNNSFAVSCFCCNLPCSVHAKGMFCPTHLVLAHKNSNNMVGSCRFCTLASLNMAQLPRLALTCD